MRADADLMVYVGARWPGLVREAVLLGCPPEQAADAVTDALSRCRDDWGRTSRDEDVDHLVHQELLAAVRHRPGTDPADRERAAAEVLVLAPPTVDDLAHRVRQLRRATRRRALKVAVPLVLLVAAGAGAYAATQDHPPRDRPGRDVLGPVAVDRSENPAPGVVWYADGRLHLDHVALRVDGITDMTRVGLGVVYGDKQGRVVYARDDGSRTLLGHKDPRSRLAATDETGRAAWVDTTGARPRVVVYDVDAERLAERVPVEPGARVVAVDGDAVYYVDDTGAHASLASSGTDTIPVTPATLLDVRSRIRAFQVDEETVQVVQSSFDVVHDLPGRGAWLSPDGYVVATFRPDTLRLAVYDTRSGTELPSGLGPDDMVLAVAPGARETIAYVVRPGGETAGDDPYLELRTCDLVDTTCRTAAELPASEDTPVLAR